MKVGAENDRARERRKPPRGADAGGGGAGGGGDRGGSLTVLAAVQGVFHFLLAPADVLRAATACRRWRELACADSVWRARFEREGLLEKAGVFEVALPAVEGGGGGVSSSSSAAAASERDELAGIGPGVLRAGVRAGGKGYYAGCAAGRAFSFCRSASASPPLAPAVAARCGLCQGYKMRDEARYGSRHPRPRRWHPDGRERVVQ